MVRRNACRAVAPLIRSLGGDDFATQFIRHDFEGTEVARALHDVHEGIHAQLGKAVVRVQLAHERGVGLADGLRDVPGRRFAFEDELVHGLVDFGHTFSPGHKMLSPVVIGRYRAGPPWFPNPRHRRAPMPLVPADPVRLVRTRRSGSPVVVK